MILVNKRTIFLISVVLGVLLISLFGDVAFGAPVQVADLQSISTEYKQVLEKTTDTFRKVATFLFFSLGGISIVFRFYPQLISGDANIQTIFLEIVKLCLIYGFFYSLLAPDSPIEITKIGKLLINDTPTMLVQKGYQVASPAFSFGVFPDIGISILVALVEKSSIWEPNVALMSVLVGLIIIALLTIIGVKYLVLTIQAWITLYAGMIFLGFASLDATSDIAKTYLKSLIALMVEMFVFLTIAYTGREVMLSTISALSKGDLSYATLAYLLMQSIAIMMLCSSVPQYISGFVLSASMAQDHKAFSNSGRVAVAGAKGAVNAYRGAQAANTAMKAGQSVASVGAGAPLAFKAGVQIAKTVGNMGRRK